MPVPRPVSTEEVHGAPADPVVRTLVMTDLVANTRMVEQLGDNRAYEIATRHDRAARDLLSRFHGLEIDKTDGFLLLFERPIDAVTFALAYHRMLADLSRELGVELEARAGIHLGEVLLHENPATDVARGAKRLEVEGIAKPTVARLASLARGGQTLLTQAAFDLARRSAVDAELPERISWLAHGAYRFKGVEEPLEIFEAGRVGLAPLSVPPDTEKAQRVVAADDELTLGWRPAPDQRIPLRPNWVLEQRIGTGGFGEVWLASHEKTHEKRVFKFCLEADRLRSLKREITLFRLLKEALGHRDDIARVLDCNFEEAPYFLESEYTEGGNLIEWAEEQGGLSVVPLATRLELVAQVAEALAAAHSVGVLHKDVKPANVLVRSDQDGRPKAQLTDFGIGRLLDASMLSDRGITLMGMTEMLPCGEESLTGGTYLYMAPEVIEGKPATVQADVYALGVMLYQMVVGDFAHPLSTGWRRDVPDEILADDVARLVDGSPERRPGSAAEVADGLRRLDERRAELAARRARERAQRRWKLFASIGALATVVLIIVSLLAVQATQARREADLRRGQAEDLISFMLGDLRQKLQRLGRLDILNDVGDKALQYFASVPEHDLTDEELFRQSNAVMQIGQVRIAEGRPDEAMEAIQESLELSRALTERDPTNVDWKKSLSERHFWIGRILWDQGDLDGALVRFRTQLGIIEDLVRSQPENLDLRFNTAYARNNIGFILEARGDLEGALEAYLETLAIKQELVKKEPADTRRLHSLASSHNTVGSALMKLGRLNEALTHFLAEQAIAEEMTENEPENTRWQRKLTVNHNFVGRVLESRGDRDGAREHYQESLRLAKKLAAIDAAHTIWQQDLAVALRRFGLDSRARGQLAQALEHVQQSKNILQELVEKDPTKAAFQIDLAIGHLSVGEVKIAKKDFEGAEKEAQEALAILQPLTEMNQMDQQSHARLSEAYLLSGRALAKLARQEEALARIRRAALVIEPFARSSTDANLLEPWVRALLHLGREDAAEPIIERLRSYGYDVEGLLASIDKGAGAN